jgi:hypothetical protein
VLFRSGLAGIQVFFPQHLIAIPGTNKKLPLGHAGVVAANEKTGHTQYYEYGRYGGSYGSVRRVGVPDLVMENGKPTEASLKNLYDSLSKSVGDGLFVTGAYFADADYQKIVDFAEGRMNAPNRAPYSWIPIPGTYNTCFSFADDAIDAGRTSFIEWIYELFVRNS